MPTRKKTRRKAKKAIDRFSGKRGPGRPRQADPWEVSVRARRELRPVLEESWESLEHPFLYAKDKGAYKAAMASLSPDLRKHFPASLFQTILDTRHDPKFPKTPKARIKFFAESLAAMGNVGPRRSRELCAEMAKNPPHRIIRREFVIECSCGYEGESLHECCPDCGAVVPGALLAMFPH